MVRVTRSKKVHIPEDSTAIDSPLKPKLLSSNTLAETSPSKINFQLVRSAIPISAETKVTDESSKKCLKGKRGISSRSKLHDGPKSHRYSPQTGVKNNLDVWPKKEPKNSSQFLVSSKDTKPGCIPQCIAHFTDKDGNEVTKSSIPTETTINYIRPSNQAALTWPTNNDMVKPKYQDSTNEDSILDSEEDSFIQQIISRSPAKLVPRADDPVEALDQIEEALEALDEVAKVELLVKRVKHPNHQQLTSNNESTASSTTELSYRRRTKSIHPIFPKRNISEPKEPSRREPCTLITGSNSGKVTISSKVADSSKLTKTPVRSHHTQRRSTFQPTFTNQIKSTKPLTRPNFELPGEAVARKLKQQREDRIALRQSINNGDQTSLNNPKAGFPIVKPQVTKITPYKHQTNTSFKYNDSIEVGVRGSDISDLPPKGSINPISHRSSTSSILGASHALWDNLNSEKPSYSNLVRKSSNASPQCSPNTSPGRPSCAVPIIPTPIPVKLNLPAAGPQTPTIKTQLQISTKSRNNNLTLPPSKPQESELGSPCRGLREVSNTAVSNARIEAAERGRQATLKWAEEQLIKR